MFDNRRAFVYDGKDSKIEYKIWNKLHTEMVLSMNVYAYVVLNHLLLQKIFHILDKDDDY